jgi:hypothetical protein
MRAIRPIRIDGGVAYVPLTRGYEAAIDAADVSLVAAWNWCAVPRLNTVYAKRADYSGGRYRNVYLHRVIVAAPDGVVVDHKSGDGLDNRRANLRLASTSQNQQNSHKRSDNSSGVKGVSFNKAHGKWEAEVQMNGLRRRLGLFAKLDDAASAVSVARAELHGVFGRAA